MGLFDPERLAIYRLAREHNRAVHSLIRCSRTRGYSDLVVQYRRSVTSIPANVLEAMGEWRLGKRLHYFCIAKGSTWESWAHTDSFVDFELAPEEAILDVRNLQKQMTAVLITSIRNLEAQGIKEELPFPKRI